MKAKYFITILLLFSLSAVSALSVVHTSNTAEFSYYTGNITNLSEMQDVNIPTPANGEFLTFNSATSKWVASAYSFFDGTWASLTGKPTLLSYFTDDLGDRGYDSLSNFTDDLGDRGYDSLSNFTNDLGVINGTDGIDGTDGYTPIYGTDYINGTNGADGYTPIYGTDYINGTDGTDGTNGVDGIDGTNGTDGEDGYTPIYGTDYINGTDGEQGIPGTDGINGTFTDTLNETQFNNDTTLWSIDISWLTNFINSFGFLTSYTETDPKWTANYSDFLDSPTWENIINGTMFSTADWNSNYTANNDDWLLDTDTWSTNFTDYFTSAEIITYINSNDTTVNNSMKAYVDSLNHDGILWASAINGTLLSQEDWNTNYTANDADWRLDTDTFAANYSDYLVARAYALNDTDWNSTGYIKDWSVDIGIANTSLKDYADATFLTDYTETDPLSLHLSQDNWDNGANDYLTWDGNSLQFNDSLLATTYYNATSGSAVTGTTAGTIQLTQHPDGNYDGVTFNVTEAAGGPGLDVRVNFTDGIETITTGIVRYRTSALAGDRPLVQLWSYESSTWEDYNQLIESETFRVVTEGIYDGSEHVQDGTVQMRLYKEANGNTGNHYYFDWMAVAKGYGTPSGQETDPIWKSERDNYYNSTQTDSQIVLANTSIKDYADATFLTSYTETDSLAYNGTLAFNSSLTNYYPLANPYDYYNSTDFSISDYVLTSALNYYTDSDIDGTETAFTGWDKDASDDLALSTITGFNYYNSTDFSIGDYYLDSNPDNFIDWSNAVNGTLLTSETFTQTEFDTNYTANDAAYRLDTDTDTWATNFTNYITKANTILYINANDTTVNNSMKAYVDETFLTSYSESDPYWTANQSSYSTTSDIVGFSYYNATDFSIDDYYLKSNPYGYYNSTNPSPDTDTFVGNYSTFLNHISWADATNGTLLTQAEWNTNYTANDAAWRLDTDTFAGNYSDYLGLFNWNKTYADTLYYGIGNPSGYISSYTETDPLWTANQSSYSTTASANLLYADINYMTNNTFYPYSGNPSGFLTSFTETDPYWTGNSSLVVYTADTTAWDKNAADDFDGAYASLSGSPTALTDFSNDLGIGNWTADRTSYSTTSEANGLYYGIGNPYGFYNSSDFSITNYFTKTEIGNFNYYNSSDFSIGDYSTTTQANGLYAPINYGDDWNKTYADTLYQPTGSYLTSESDPLWTANQSSYSTKTVADGLYADISIVSNPFDQELNTTSNVEFNNVTVVDCITFSNGAQLCGV